MRWIGQSPELTVAHAPPVDEKNTLGGEDSEQGRMAPEEFYVFQPTLKLDYRRLLWKRLGIKEPCTANCEAGDTLVKELPVSTQTRPAAPPQKRGKRS